MSNEADEAARDAIINRIRKILSKVNHEGGATDTPEAEIEASLAMARKLMDKFNIEETEVLSSDSGKKTFADELTKKEIFSRAGKIDIHDVKLARVIVNLFDIRYYLSDKDVKTEEPRTGRPLGTWQRRELLFFYGHPRDIDVGKALYLELLATMRAMARFRCGKGKWIRDHVSYCEGFVDNLISRSAELKRKSQDAAAANTTAIVLAKEQIIKDYGKQTLGLVPGRSRSYKQDLTGAYSDGYKDGNNVSLSSTGLPKTASVSARLDVKA